MNWAGITSLITNMAKLPATVLIAMVIVLFILLGGIGIGVGRAFRDIPQYIYLIILSILNFVLLVFGRQQINCQLQTPSEDGIRAERKIKKNSISLRHNVVKAIKPEKKCTPIKKQAQKNKE